MKSSYGGLIMNKSHLLGAVCACIFSLGFSTTAQSAVTDAYFGMNFIGSPQGVTEVQLLDITYIGGGGGVFITPMPAAGGMTPAGELSVGLPDGLGPAATPTYLVGGDGETTRTYGATVPIDWNLAPFAFPSIAITDMTFAVSGVVGTFTAEFTTPYTVGLIPLGADTELTSFLVVPQGDIYGGLLGLTGNPIGTSIATSTPPGLESLIGVASGDFIFAATSAVPVPATVEELIAELVNTVISLNLKQGISNAMDRKLDNVLRVLEDTNENNDVSAINALFAFIYSVEAQRGKGLSDAEAETLITAAQTIIDRLSE